MTLAKGYPTAILAVLKGRTVAIRKGNKHQLGLFFLLEACQRNAAGWSTAGWPANAKLPLPDRHSSITRPCCWSAQAPRSLSLHMYMHSTGSVRMRRRAVEVIICMITRDFSVISIDVTGVSLSLLQLPKVTHAQYRKRLISFTST